MDLFPHQITRVASIAISGAVPVENGSNARYAADAEGRQWVVKDVAANDLLAEALGWLISKALFVPTPTCGITGSGDDILWLSELVPNAMHWSSSRPQRMKNPAELGAMLALDAIIGNADRHPRNVLFRPAPSPDSLDMFSIDLAKSWIGVPKELEGHGLAAPDISNVIRGIPIDMIGDHALSTAQLASQLDEQIIVGAVIESCAIAREPEPERERLERALRRRCAHATEIVYKYLDDLSILT